MINRINLDKYYTPVPVARYCIDTAFKSLKDFEITDIIEPSAGNGSFSQHLNCTAYDIEPECASIHRQDYLAFNIPYKRGRLIIGNPPFGSRMNLAQKFYKKSVCIGDFIAFILPISQLNNPSSLYEFDLIYSEDLGKVVYTDRELHCCFNVYKRPDKGLNSKSSNSLDSVSIIRQDSKKYKESSFDIRICYWGNGSAGKVLTTGESYSAEYKIKVAPMFLNDVRNALEKVNWSEELNCIAALKIQQFHIIKLLKKVIPNIY